MQTLQKFKQFVDEITLENGRLYKESILLKYKDDEDIKYYLNFLLNPYIVTGISEKKLARFHLDSCIDFYPDINTFKTTKEALEYLKKHNTGTYETIDLMFSYYMKLYTLDLKPIFDNGQTTDLHSLFEKLISKNLPLGVDTKTVNKVIPELIPTFNVMLANKYFDNPKVIDGKEFAITTKIDGMRCIMLKENGNVTFWSRQGQKIDGLVDLEEEALKYFPDNITLDGELIAIVDNPDTYKDTMKRARTKDAKKHGLKMIIFDGMDINEFKQQLTKKNYMVRRAFFLDKMTYDNGGWLAENNINDYRKDASMQQWQFFNFCANRINQHLNYFEVLPILYQGTDTNKIIELLDEQTSKGEEGIMINICDAPYEFKRSNVLLKVKKFLDTEVKVVGFEAGINRLSDTLGALICNYNGNNVKVGSGFSDELRKEIWEHQEDWLNKLITVKYFEESYDSKTGLKSLRFPIFMRVREDN